MLVLVLRTSVRCGLWMLVLRRRRRRMFMLWLPFDCCASCNGIDCAEAEAAAANRKMSKRRKAAGRPW